MTNLLIVTSKNDAHADAVIRELNQTTVNPIRLNSDDFIQNSQYSYSWDSTGEICNQFLAFHDSLRTVQEINVIWWRKPQDYQVYDSVTDEWAVKYCQSETNFLLLSLPGIYPYAKWVNNYHDLRYPSQRINQIPIAKQLGIPIPPTLVTNYFKPAVDFLNYYGECIIKPMNYSGFLHKHEQYACYTRKIDIDTLSQFHESIQFAPIFLQKRIFKKAEYRVTLIGRKSFVCRIESDHLCDPDVSLDWRITAPEKLIHIPDTLPESYISKLFKMLKIFGLHFGAFDIIRDSDDVL